MGRLLSSASSTSTCSPASVSTWRTRAASSSEMDGTPAAAMPSLASQPLSFEFLVPLSRLKSFVKPPSVLLA